MSVLKTNVTIILILIIILYLTACKKELSREEAKIAIIQKNNLPSFETIEFAKKYYVSQYDESGSWLPAVGLWAGERYNIHQTELENLQAKEVITMQDDEKHEDNGLVWVFKSAVLTNEGKKYFVSEDDSKYIIKSSDIDFGEITGIQTNEQFKSAHVNYTLIRKNISPFAKRISQSPINKQATFVLYDDGWRLE